MDVVGEGGEEVATTAILPWVKRAIYDPDAELPTAEQLVEASIGGMIGGAIWEGVGSVTSKSPYKSSTRNVETVDNAYDVDVAIGRFVDGTATDADFKLFAPENTANRQALYEATGIKLPIDSRLTNYSLLALNNKNRNIHNMYLNRKIPKINNITLPEYVKHIENPDSLTGNGESTFEKMRTNEKRDCEQYIEYIGVLGKNNMPETFDKFQLLKYNNIVGWNKKQREYRTIYEISKKPWNDTFKQYAITAYYGFLGENIEMTCHALSRYLPRSQKGFYEFENIVDICHNKYYNYVEQDNDDIKFVKYYDDIAVIYNYSKEEIVSIVRRKNPKKEWSNYDN